MYHILFIIIVPNFSGVIHIFEDESHVYFEALIKMSVSKSASLWMSLTIWKICSSEMKSVFRNYEKAYLKFLTLKS